MHWQTPASALVLLCAVFSFGVVKGQFDTEEEENAILNWKPPSDFKRKFPYYLSGYDKDGSPVIVLEAGKWDYRTALEEGREEDLDKHISQMFIKWKRIGNQKEDSPGALIIYDVEGFDARQAGSPRVITFLIRQFPKFAAINRTPGLKHIYAINVNYLAQQVWNLGRPLLGSLQNKVDVFGSNADRWKPVLLKEIDPDQIPEWYGGSGDHKVLAVYPPV